MPHPSQMGGFEDESLGGCILNTILLVVVVLAYIACSGVHG